MLNYHLVAVVSLLYQVSIHAYCPSWIQTNYSADTSEQSIDFDSYSNNWDCTFYINGNQKSSSFLQMTWESFDVMGNMPNCDQDYVQVFLTSSYKSIGRFCSSKSDAASPFNMYSRDGYAKITFHSDNEHTGTGFKLTFKLRMTSSDYLGDLNDCSNTYFDGNIAAGVMCSTKWPKQYDQSYSKDIFYIYSYSNKKTKIIFMDIDLDQSFGCRDYVEVKGSDSSSEYDATIVKSSICKQSYPVTITTSYKYVFVVFSHSHGTTSSNPRRGFVAGYTIYDDDSLGMSTIIGLSVGGVLFCIITGVLMYCCCCRKSGNRGHIVRQPQQQERAATITTTTTTVATPGQYAPAPGYYDPGYHAPSYHDAVYPQQSTLPSAPPPYADVPSVPYADVPAAQYPPMGNLAGEPSTQYLPPHPAYSDSNVYSNPPPPDSLCRPLLHK